MTTAPMTTAPTAPAPATLLARPEAAHASPVGVAVGIAVLPVLGLIGATWAGYDVGLVRASVMLGELAVIGLLAPAGALGKVWRHTPVWIRATLTVWFGAQLVTTAAAVHVGPAVFRTTEWAVHLAFGAALWQWIGGRQSRMSRVVGAAAVGALGACVFAVGVWTSQVWQGVSMSSAELPFGHPRFIGFFAMAAVTFGLGVRPDGRGARSVVWHAGWALAWAVLCWSGGRGSIGAAGLGVGVWAVLARPSWRSSLAAAMTAAVGTALSLALPADPRSMGLMRIFQRTVAPGGDFTSQRDLLWEHLLQAWSARPLLGLGPDGPAFSLVSTPHAHNTFVQALVEWGAVGAAAFAVLLLVVTVRAVGAARGSRAVGAAAAFWIAASANGLLDGLFYGAETLVLLAVATAALMPPPRESPDTLQNTERSAAPRQRAVGWTTARMALALVPLVCFATYTARFNGGTPEPDSVRARVALAAPVSYRSTEVLWWSKDWAATHPQAALDAARWGQRHSRTPWSFSSVEGDLWAAAGDSTRAVTLWRRAGRERAAAPVTAH